MEEIIEIIIRLLVGLFENKAVNTSNQRRTLPPPIATAPTPAIAIKKTAPRRAVRRPAPPIIAMAEPIITKVPTMTTAPMIPMARSIVANTGIAKANAVPPESAASIRKWLTPVTLKNQFLLTEILQPPLALRNEKRF